MRLHRFDLIVGLYILGIVTAQLMGAKVISLGALFGIPINVSVAIFLMPLLFTITDVVVELFGKNRARSLVWTGVIVIVLLTAYTLLVTALPAGSRFMESEEAYDAIFNTSLRFAAASIAAFTTAEIIDVLIYDKLRARMQHSGMWLRNNVSNFVGQFIDSIVFVTIAFYAFDMSFSANALFLLSVVLPYWGARCVMSIFSTPLAYMGVNFLERSRSQEKGAIE